MALQTFANGESLSSVRTKINANFTELYGNMSALQPLDSTLTTLSGKATTGTGDIVLATSPTLITPVLGVASASSITIGWASGNTLVVDTSTLVVDATNNRVWMLTTAPTHTLTQWSTGTGIALHNQSDQTTNFENGWIKWNGNVMFVWTWKWWSGTQRGVSLSSSSWQFDGSSGNATRLTVTQGAGVNFNFNSTSTWNIQEYIKTPSTFTASSVVTSILSLSPTINMTSTGWFCLLDLNPILSATWSWAKNAILYRNSSWWTLFGVDSNWGVLNARVISANAATPVNITAFDSNKVYTNEWASAKIVFNLPTAVAGYTYTFIVQDTDWIDVKAAAWDTIRRNTNVTAAAWTVTSTAIGSVLVLVAINATERISVTEIGTWA